MQTAIVILILFGAAAQLIAIIAKIAMNDSDDKEDNIGE